MYTWILVFTVFLKNRNISSKIKRSKVTDYAASNKAIGIIIFAKPFLNFIDDTMIWYLNSKLDLNLSCAKDFWNLNSTVTWFINWRRLLELLNTNISAPFSWKGISEIASGYSNKMSSSAKPSASFVSNLTLFSTSSISPYYGDVTYCIATSQLK